MRIFPIIGILSFMTISLLNCETRIQKSPVVLDSLDVVYFRLPDLPLSNIKAVATIWGNPSDSFDIAIERRGHKRIWVYDQFGISFMEHADSLLIHSVDFEQYVGSLLYHHLVFSNRTSLRELRRLFPQSYQHRRTFEGESPGNVKLIFHDEQALGFLEMEFRDGRLISFDYVIR